MRRSRDNSLIRPSPRTPDCIHGPAFRIAESYDEFETGRQPVRWGRRMKKRDPKSCDHNRSETVSFIRSALETRSHRVRRFAQISEFRRKSVVDEDYRAGGI